MEISYMRRALELAAKGTGFTSPNPLVGAVIVKENRIIGEGYHERYGGHHAEINAFNNATEDVRDATMYVHWSLALIMEKPLLVPMPSWKKESEK